MGVSLITTGSFLIASFLIVLLILTLSRRTEKQRGQPTERENETSSVKALAQTPGALKVEQVLDWEFEYARVTASEAMSDRHTMVNFYLIIVGITVSGVTGAIGTQFSIPPWLGAVLLWLLCGIGWLYFFKLIRLRQAWYDSARAMNQIKEFYILHNQEFPEIELRSAFRWQASSLPAENKPWTLFFFEALLIGFLSASAYFVGGLLLELDLSQPEVSWAWLAIMGVMATLYFVLHIYFYFAFLQQRKAKPA